MDTFFAEAVKQVPGLAVLVVLSWLFLKSMEKERVSVAEQFRIIQAEYLRTLKEIQAENLEARTTSKEAIKENTAVSLQMTAALNQLIGAVRENTNHKT